MTADRHAQKIDTRMRSERIQRSGQGRGSEHPELTPMMQAVSPRAVALFFALTLLSYAALSPAVFRSMGYANEEVEAGERVLSRIGLYSQAEGPGVWPRNGVATVVAHLPFLAISHLVLGESPGAEDWLLSFEPILFTAGLLTILFAWSASLSGNSRFALVLSLGAGFATMLWPYAYIGLEVQQSFFLLLSAFLVLGLRWRASLPKVILFSLCAGFAISVKTAGTVLIPAILFLAWKLFEGERKTAPVTLFKMSVAFAIAGVMYKGNSYLQMMFWNEWGGSGDYLREWLVRDPIAFYINVVGFIGSPNKGLIVFAPLAVIALLRLPVAFRKHRDVTLFALLAFVPPLLGFSALMIWTDENWGPRYLHESIAPLTLVIAVAGRGEDLRLRRSIPLLAALGAGLIVSFLGAFFSYGALQYVAAQTGQATLERFQSDPVWNHVRFNARLLRVWLSSEDSDQTLWTPSHHHWDFSGKSKPAEVRSANLQEVMTPQAVLVRNGGTAPGEPGFGPWIVALVSLFASPLVLWRLWLETDTRPKDTAALVDEPPRDS